MVKKRFMNSFDVIFEKFNGFWKFRFLQPLSTFDILKCGNVLQIIQLKKI